MPNNIEDNENANGAAKSSSVRNNTIIRLHKPPKHKQLRRAAHTPWMAFGALTLAALTVFLILALLLAINNQPTWPSGGIYGLVQPASVLSLLLSVSEILLAYGLAAGFETAWSYQAHKPDATVATAQDFYAAGSSTFDAVRLMKRCFYLSVAVLLCALTPILGFILQGAITTRIDDVVVPVNMSFPIVQNLDVGFSSQQISGSYWESAWNRIWQQVLNVGGAQFTQFAYFGSISDFTNSTFDFGYDNSSVYSTTVIGAGFSSVCSQPQIAFDLLPTSNRSLTTGLIFSSSVGWVPQRPNEISVNILWKIGSPCSGVYQSQNCTLRAARVEYATQIQMSVSGSPYRGPFFSLIRLNKTHPADRVISILPVARNEGRNNQWTYSGIATSLAETFNSTVTTFDSYLLPAYGQVGSTGNFGLSLRPSYLNPQASQPVQGLYTNGTGPRTYYCNLSFDGGLQELAYFELIDSDTINTSVEQGVIPDNVFADPAKIIINKIRQAMFLASIYSGSRVFTNSWNYNDTNPTSRFNSSNSTIHPASPKSISNTTIPTVNATTNLPYPASHYFQTIPATQTTTRVLYSVRVYLWGIALLVSWLIIISVLPLFWGYWMLDRPPDMTPAGIGRVFQSPLMILEAHTDDERDEGIDTDDVVKEVGIRRVNERTVHSGREDDAQKEGGS